MVNCFRNFIGLPNTSWRSYSKNLRTRFKVHLYLGGEFTMAGSRKRMRENKKFGFERKEENSLFHKIKKMLMFRKFLIPENGRNWKIYIQNNIKFKNSDKTHLAELVTIHDQLFNDWLLETLTREFDESYYYRSYWIGLRKVDFDHKMKAFPWMIRIFKFIWILGLCAKRASLNGSMVLHLSMRIGKEKFNLL